MTQEKHVVIGLHLFNRNKCAVELQKLFTDYGCNIKTRLGLHEVNENYCADAGIILLEMTGDKNRITEFVEKVQKVDGVEFQQMVFDH